MRICVDYRDLNKASPKDDFLLPHVDVLVDNTSGHAPFSFPDDFSGYNIFEWLWRIDRTSFISPWSIFCYKGMSFAWRMLGPHIRGDDPNFPMIWYTKQWKSSLTTWWPNPWRKWIILLTWKDCWTAKKKCAHKLTQEMCTMQPSTNGFLSQSA